MNSFFKRKTRRYPSSKSDTIKQSRDRWPLTCNITDTVSHIRESFKDMDDLIVRETRLAAFPDIRLALIYIKGMSDTASLQQGFLSERSARPYPDAFIDQDVVDYIKEAVLNLSETEEIRDFDTLNTAIISGDAVILAEGHSLALTVGMKGGDRRAVEEPSTQSVIRGPRQGFTETIGINTTLVRRIIKDTRLRMESRQLGGITKTKVMMMYIQGIADDSVIEEVRSRLDKIDIDAVLESGYIEELIQETKFTPFPTVFNTERPDVTAAWLLEGRVAIFVDGTPFVLLVPALFSQFFNAPEDYYQRADFATLLRLLRYLSLFIALLAPSIYITFTTFHQELLPTSLLVSLAGQREGVPFPAFVEALMMEITFEILREAGVRMPKTIGQSVSIVGTLVIGQSAVEAGIVSPAMVIVVSITAIANFVIPAFSMGISIRMLRMAMMGLAASFGLFGLILGLIVIILHLCSLQSFGVSYMSPFAPLVPAELKDSIFRLPRGIKLFGSGSTGKKKSVRRQKGSNHSPDEENRP